MPKARLEVTGRAAGAGASAKATRNPKPDPDSCLTMGIVEAGAMLGLTRNGSYAAANRGEIPILKFGKRIMVPKLAFQRMLERAGVVEAASAAEAQ